MKIPEPVIYEINYSKKELDILETRMKNEDKQNQKIIFRYPTVYIVNDQKSTSGYSVYVGETTDIKRRTAEHLKTDPIFREDWKELADSEKAKMFVIGHNHFNKSLTLDIENRLMQYLSSVESVVSVNNRRTNQQNEYYTSEEFESVFSKIWRKLQKMNKELFPLERIIKDSALFKASPFHKLTREQMNAREKIILKITEALNRNQEEQLIIVEGEAGSGKTVLMSSLFYELHQLSLENSENVVLQNTTQYLLVNHGQQLKVYEQIASKLGILSKRHPDVISKPTKFINNHSEDRKVDVVIVDEAHLLWTQGKQSYRGENQLEDLLKRAKVVVAVLDRNQILSREQYWEEQEMLKTIHDVNLKGNYIHLDNQLRINADKKTVDWIRNFIDRGLIETIPTDSKKYSIQIFSDPDEMYRKIQQKAQDETSGISRLLATFDWEYVDKRQSEEEYWYVKIGKWKLPWNLQIHQSKEEKRKNKKRAWAEQPQTIHEVGSTFTIQGFDLNYAGVIIGPSVKYRNGQLFFDKTASKNKKATQMRGLKNGDKLDVSEFLLRNELNVLLTRGVNGLYIYAVDKELREALLKAKNQEQGK
ncbi:DUF2075 domain-containing protein [Enterococcus sp. JM9B]|uniref:DUF2075 domain-containing protein n=1 Tax=Enterococcus sp. JM9B TaxID=1857216 RepID=UPI00137524B6|nr:DUF2075 domain-containing protein [Enterococcus sp. JM9B]KAF1301592.1 ATP-dependent exonuclease [Enterococcus sp. JM9B]